MKYKALMLDVDGTTIPSKLDGMPSDKVISAIQKAQKILHVGLATSRPLSALRHIFDKLNIDGPSIINGGARIIDSKTHKVLWEQGIDLKDAKNVFKIIKAKSYKGYFNDGGEDLIIENLPNDFLPKNPLEIAAIGLTNEEHEILHKEISKIPTLVTHSLKSWQKGKLDIIVNHASATKLHGILKVAEILGIKTSEIIGVGDGGNDMPLLLSCGLKVAMGNAIDDLKAIADYVAPTVKEDGVAHVIKKFVLR